MSAPATNAFSPAPETRTTLTWASSLARATAASISCMVSRSSAFSFSGRLMVRRAIPSRASYRTRPPGDVMTGPPRRSPRHQEIVGSRRLDRIVVEAAAALAPEEAGHHHPLHQGRCREPLLPELLEHDVGNVVGRVDADQIVQGQRAHGVATAELHP